MPQPAKRNKKKIGTYQIRRMTAVDVDAVMIIERHAYPFPWTEGIFRDCLRVGYGCWIIERDAENHGYCVMMVGGGDAHVLNLCVKPESRGQGLGRIMLAYMMDKARRLTVETLLLEVRPSNRTAIQLYHSVGFNEIGVRKNYYPAQNGREDALILALHL